MREISSLVRDWVASEGRHCLLMRWCIQPGLICSRSNFTQVRSLVRGQLPETAVCMSLAGLAMSNRCNTYQSHHMDVCQLLNVLLSTLLPSVLLDRTVRRLFGRFGRCHLVTDCVERKWGWGERCGDMKQRVRGCNDDDVHERHSPKEKTTSYCTHARSIISPSLQIREFLWKPTLSGKLHPARTSVRLEPR
jgi:hypothetical protein